MRDYLNIMVMGIGFLVIILLLGFYKRSSNPGEPLVLTTQQRVKSTKLLGFRGYVIAAKDGKYLIRFAIEGDGIRELWMERWEIRPID